MVMEYIVAALIFAVYIWLIVFAVRGGNMTFGFFFTGVIWMLICILAWKTGILSEEFLAANQDIAETPWMEMINTVFQDGIRSQGLQTVDIITGAFFGAVLMETGISQTLIKKTVELGGDKPLLVMILLDIVVAALFTSIFGIGAVIALGIIVLPILFSLGVPKVIACLSYLFSVAAGNYLNPVLNASSFTTYSTEGDTQKYFYQDWASSFGYIATIVATVFVVIMTIILMANNKKKTQKAWAAPVEEAPEDQKKTPPTIALFIPFMPTLTILIFKTENIPTFILWGIVALAVCGYCKTLKSTAENYTKCMYNGVIESAGLIVFLLMLACITKTINYAKPFISLVLEPIIPKNAEVWLCIAVAVLAPLALFRGPLTMYGTAGPIFLILVSFGYSYSFLFPLMFVPSISMNMAACPTQSYVAWGVNYAGIEVKDYLKRSLVWGWIFTAVMEVVVIFTVA
jgi:hypothetical protein